MDRSKEIRGLLAEIYLLRNNRDAVLAPELLEIAERETEIAYLRRTLDEKGGKYNTEIAEKEAEIKRLMLEQQATVIGPFGKAAYVSGYTKYTYDAKALNSVAKSDPDSAWVLLHRKAKEVKPRVTIKIKEE